jgi:hypothetical protein
LELYFFIRFHRKKVFGGIEQQFGIYFAELVDPLCFIDIHNHSLRQFFKTPANGCSAASLANNRVFTMQVMQHSYHG